MSQDNNSNYYRNISPEAQEAADYAVKKTFAILGVNIDDAESVEKFRENLRFGERLKKAADHGFMAFISIVVILVATGIWSSFSDRIGL